MIEFRTLENVSLEAILNAFNRSFENYFVDIQLSLDDLKNKLQADGFSPEFSVGAFDNESLVAFVLHSSRETNEGKLIYNGGTGVRPEYRGKALTQRMYEFIKPILQSEGALNCSLEVIADNIGALKAYQACGFETLRKFNCLKGQVPYTAQKQSPNIKELGERNWDQLQSFWDWQPSWQHQPISVENAEPFLKAFGYYNTDRLLGYIIYNPQTKRVLQFAVDKNYRGQGLGFSLFKKIASQVNSEIFTINIDNEAHETLSFLNAVGLNSVLMQYEMVLNFD